MIISKKIFISTIIAFSLITYFTYYGLFGDKGLVKYFKLKRELQKKELVRKGLENKMNNQKNMVNSMESGSLDLDLLDEQARKNLGYSNKDEIVIYHQ